MNKENYNTSSFLLVDKNDISKVYEEISQFDLINKYFNGNRIAFLNYLIFQNTNGYALNDKYIVVDNYEIFELYDIDDNFIAKGYKKDVAPSLIKQLKISSSHTNSLFSKMKSEDLHIYYGKTFKLKRIKTWELKK